MKKILALALAVLMVLGLFAACGPKDPTQPQQGGNDPKPTNPEENPLAGTYDVTLWVSELDGVAALTQEQIDAFEAANPGIVINASIEGVTEADAGSKVIADVASAPDIYCFAQDQLARLVQAAALAQPGTQAAANIKEANDAGSVAAATVAGTLYAYPMTSDNGYYMYYDKSIISDEDAESLEKIIAACEANGVKLMEVLTGFKFIGEKMTEFEETKEYTYIFGFEESYCYLCGGYARDKDAVSASMLIVEMAAFYAKQGKTLYDVLCGIFEKYGYYVEGVQNLAFHPKAFAFVCRPLAQPAGVESYTTSYGGISLRVVKGYDMKFKKETLSMDVLYGFKTVYPELAVRCLG